VDSHRNYPPDQPDGQWYQPERGYPDPEWDRRGADPRFAAQPGEPPQYTEPPQYAEPPQYTEPPAYNDQAPRYGDNAGYAEQEPYRVPEPRGGYQPEAYGPPATQGAGVATGRVAPVGPRSGEPLPPLPAGHIAPHSAPPEAPISPAASHTAAFAMPQQAHAAPTSGLPQVGSDRTAAQPASGAGAGASGPDEGDGQPVRYATEPLDRAALRRPSGGPGQLGDGVYRSRRPGTAAVLVVITVLFELLALRLLAAAFFHSPVLIGGSIASAFLVLGLPMFGLGMYGLLSGAAAAPGAGARAWLRAPLVYLPVALVLLLASGLAAA
jgi:hypothetical protein